jgi:hypothetical protein
VEEANPSGKENAGKSYVIFGKKDSTAIELSAIASGTGGFVINGENAHDWSGLIKSSKPSPLTSPAVEAMPPASPIFSPLIAKPCAKVFTDIVMDRSASLPATSVATMGHLR